MYNVLSPTYLKKVEMRCRDIHLERLKTPKVPHIATMKYNMISKSVVVIMPKSKKMAAMAGIANNNTIHDEPWWFITPTHLCDR